MSLLDSPNPTVLLMRGQDQGKHPVRTQKKVSHVDFHRATPAPHLHLRLQV